jgi:hypothetical protein
MINKTLKPNPSLHVWLDAPGIWDELVDMAEPGKSDSSDLRLDAEYLMSRSVEDIERVGWYVMQDDKLWDALNQSIRESIIEVVRELRQADEQVLSSTDGQNK